MKRGQLALKQSQPDVPLPDFSNVLRFFLTAQGFFNIITTSVGLV
jgi:hypothetical protein